MLRHHMPGYKRIFAKVPRRPTTTTRRLRFLYIVWFMNDFFTISAKCATVRHTIYWFLSNLPHVSFPPGWIYELFTLVVLQVSKIRLVYKNSINYFKNLRNCWEILDLEKDNNGNMLKNVSLLGQLSLQKHNNKQR